jgi:hypothetical protein
MENWITTAQIFGTDLNEKGIQKARAGIYRETILDEISPERLQRFFVKVPGGYRVNKAEFASLILQHQHQEKLLKETECNRSIGAGSSAGPSHQQPVAKPYEYNLPCSTRQGEYRTAPRSSRNRFEVSLGAGRVVAQRF